MQALAAGDPRQLGAYRLHARLGHGGMGQVYLGFSPAGRSVAVKVLHPALARDEAFLIRFGLEVAAAREVSAVYTAPVVAAGLGDHPPWLATAFVPGPSLAELVERTGPLAESALWRLTAGLVEALQAIHDRAVVHRDLKPSNVLLADDGPRVIDFGLAGALYDAAPNTGRLVIGSPPFMSPEQARGAPAGAAGDVFSLGAVIAFAGTGYPPFGQGDPAEVLHRVLHVAPGLDGLPAGLRQIAAACLAKAPTDRPALPELARAIEAGLVPWSGASATSFWPEAMSRHIRAFQSDRADPAPVAAGEAAHRTAPQRPWPAEADSGRTATVTAPRAAEATQVLARVPGHAAPERAGRRPLTWAVAVLGTAAAAAVAAIAVHLAYAHHAPGGQPVAAARHSRTASRTPAPLPELTSFLDNAGITDDADPAAGNLDGAGSSFSAEALAAAHLTPGAAFSHDGVNFTWPNVAPGSADNVVADGQTIGLPGTGQTLGILGTSDYGTATGTGTITYADGSTRRFTISFPDWWSNTSPPNGDVLTTLPYLNTANGKQGQADSIYYVGVPLAPAKAVRSIILPQISRSAVQGSPAMHIFALSIGG